MNRDKQTFYCDNHRWEIFLTACREDGLDASTQIRALIDKWLDERWVESNACKVCGTCTDFHTDELCIK